MQPTTKHRLRFILVPAAVLAALALTAEVLLRLVFPPGFATGDPMDIHLVGVYTGSSTDLRDASGGIIGDTLATADWPERIIPVDEGVDRYFIFRLPDTPAEIVVHSEYHWPLYVGGGSRPHVQYSVKLRRWIQPIPFVRRWRWQVPATQVDISLSYWYGPRGPASLTFTGPFAPGATISPDNGAVGTLSISSYFSVGNGWGSWCWVSGNTPMSVHEALAYDLNGKRRVVGYHLLGGGETSGRALFVVRGLAPHEISAITFSEKPRTKTFHNVTVTYRKSANSSAAEYRDRLSKRLNVKGDSLRDAFDAPDGYLKAIDLVRGKDILRACRELEPIANEAWYAALPTAGRDRLRDALTAWTSADDPSIRRAGACLGVKVDFRGFVNAAIDLLECGDDEVRTEAAQALVENTSKLSDEDVLRLAAAALNGGGPEHNRPVVLEAITSSRAEAVPEALSRLAGDPRPWLWWRALRDERCAEFARTPAAPAPQLRVRRLIASGFNPAIASDSTMASKARVLLPTLITPEFQKSDPVAFAAVFDLLVAQCDRETAERAIWSFLTNAKDYSRAGDAIGLMVKHINLWNGINIADLGSDVKAGLPHANLYGWREIVLDALEWRDAGSVPSHVPPGYRAKKGDVRVILMKEGQPEKAGISLWIAPDSPAVVGGVHTLEVDSGFFAYSIEPSYGPYTGRIDGPPGAGRYDLTYEFECEGYEAPPWGPVYFETSGGGLYPLRQTADLQPGWKVVIESADSAESIVADTRAFSDWWAKYGPSTSPAPAQVPQRADPESTQSTLTPVGKD